MDQLSRELSHRSASLSERTRAAARDVLAGERKGFAALRPFLGPAVIASVAYVDPGNFATNIQAGASFGYALLWVVLFANVTAMLFQSLSAKLGVATGRNLAELCRAHFPISVVWAMWVVSEIAAMATDVAEFLGATIALNLLLGLPLLAGTLATAVVTYGMLLLENRGFRPLEMLIGGFVGAMALCYVLEVVLARPEWRAIAYHSVVPWLGGADSLMLAVGIIGATVMPHALYLHSSLTQDRIVPKTAEDARRIVRWSNREVVLALGAAGLVNMSMMVMAAAVFHRTGHGGVASIDTAYRTLTPLLGAGAAAVFLISLLASGLSSSVVGTMAGQVVMQGFVGFRIPLWLRRLATMAPSVVVVALGYSPTTVLVISQVILSLALPIPVVALVLLTSRRDIMGPLVNSRRMTVAATGAGTIILALNIVLLLQTFGVELPLP